MLQQKLENKPTKADILEALREVRTGPYQMSERFINRAICAALEFLIEKRDAVGKEGEQT